MTITIEKYCRSSTETIDTMIFELFDLSGNGYISQRDLAQMMLTLPEKAIITTIVDQQNLTKSQGKTFFDKMNFEGLDRR